jgi:hypothetical protein
VWCISTGSCGVCSRKSPTKVETPKSSNVVRFIWLNIASTSDDDLTRHGLDREGSYGSHACATNVPHWQGWTQTYTHSSLCGIGSPPLACAIIPWYGSGVSHSAGFVFILGPAPALVRRS